MKKWVIATVLCVTVCLFIYFYNFHSFSTKSNSNSVKLSNSIAHSVKYQMSITSVAFTNDALIPTVYTCDGKGINPPLTFHNVPKTAKSLVLLIEDPDVPKNLLTTGVFDHWVIYNIDPDVSSIKQDSTPPGIQGLNSTGIDNYYPPCPPDRKHRYFINLYALNTRLNFYDPTKVTRQMVMDALKGHIITTAELIGLYNRLQNK